LVSGTFLNQKRPFFDIFWSKNDQMLHNCKFSTNFPRLNTFKPGNKIFFSNHLQRFRSKKGKIGFFGPEPQEIENLRLCCFFHIFLHKMHLMSYQTLILLFFYSSYVQMSSKTLIWPTVGKWGILCCSLDLPI